MPVQISDQLLTLLACPKCQAGLRQEGEKLVCDKCSTTYPLKKVSGPDGKGMLIPDFLNDGDN